jgi:subtilisin family serine protease
MKPDRLSVSFFSAFILVLLSSCHSDGLSDHHKVKTSSYRTNVIQGRYIVELTHQDSVSPFVDLLTATFADNVKVGQRFTHSNFNGVSFSLSSPQSHHDKMLHSIFDHANVVSVYPSTRMNAPTLASMETPTESSISKAISDVMSPHQLTQVNRVHQELKHTGKGILIGIIDSGVDYYHPALGGGFGKGFKVTPYTAVVRRMAY